MRKYEYEMGVLTYNSICRAMALERLDGVLAVSLPISEWRLRRIFPLSMTITPGMILAKANQLQGKKYTFYNEGDE